jgi:hypothetical protein
MLITMSKLSRTPKFKRMYKIGYRFEKKTRAVMTTILSKLEDLLFYIIESRGSKGKADIVVGLYHPKSGNRVWVGIQCKKGYVSVPQQKREITTAMKEHGMIMFFATPSESKDAELPVKFYPDFRGYIKSWMNM